jgi:hypothetical protein
LAAVRVCRNKPYKSCGAPNRHWKSMGSPPPNKRSMYQLLTRTGMLALTLLGGCAGWQRFVPPSDSILAPRQQVQVWRGRQAQVMHGVRLTPDSLFGVPFHQPPSCDSCVVALPRDVIDSLRLGDQEAPAIAGATLPFVVLLLLFLSLRGLRES